jgi:hypothetical protein
MAKEMDKEFITIWMEEFLKALGSMIKFRDMGFSRRLIFMKDIGLRVNSTAKGISVSKMNQYIKDNL